MMSLSKQGIYILLSFEIYYGKLVLRFNVRQYSYGFLFNCTTVGQALDSMTALT